MSRSGNIILPVYRPVRYKPGLSGTETKLNRNTFYDFVKQIGNRVRTAPCCKYSNVKEIYSARSITAPSAIGDMVAHTDCVKTVPTVQLYRAVETSLAQSKGDTHKLSVSIKIITLIEKWEEQGGLKAG